ncbi:LPXTG cell wall anchor domain-containing protein [Vagococcus sp.]|uniref:LPXTG cell wall anchor domain-containing protein n=1 Tax=Vagococcus sp. TaxID=1933889 RepID=UPI002FCAAF64
MKKKMIGLALIGMVTFGVGMVVRAEGNEVTKAEDNVTKVEKQDEQESAKDVVEQEKPIEPVKQVDPVKEVSTEVEAEKARMREAIKSFSAGPLKEQGNQLLAKVEQATTMEELQGLEVELKNLGANYSALLARNNGIGIVKDLQRLNKLTKEEADAYIERLNKAKTTDEISNITAEFSKLINVDSYLKKKDELTKYVQSLMEQFKLTQEQGDKFLKNIEESRYLEELVAVELEVAKELEKNDELTKEAFETSQKSLIEKINKLVEEGKLTKEQGNNLIAKVQKSTTIQDLMAISGETDKLVKENEAGKKTTKEPATGLQKILPQTGEKQTMINVILGIIILLGGGFAFWKVKHPKENNE